MKTRRGWNGFPVIYSAVMARDKTGSGATVQGGIRMSTAPIPDCEPWCRRRTRTGKIVDTTSKPDIKAPVICVFDDGEQAISCRGHDPHGECDRQGRMLITDEHALRFLLGERITP